VNKIIPVLAVVILAGVGIFWWAHQQTSAINGLHGSGTMEARQVRIGPEVSGRVVQVMAKEGQAVKAGDILFRLDDTTLNSQRAQAEAAVRTSRAQRDQLLANARPEQLEAAQAAIDSARAVLSGAQADLDRLLSGATSDQIAAANAQLEAAKARAKLAQDTYTDIVHGRGSAAAFGIAGTGLGAPEEQMRQQIEAANAQVMAAQERLNRLLTGATPAEIQAAQARVASAQAQLDAAQAQYNLLAAGPTREQIAAANAAVAQAEAALRVFDVQADKLIIRAPLDGIVLIRSVQAGEVIAAGATAFIIGRLDPLRLTIYLPEDSYGRVKLGQMARLKVDSYPGVTFPATVVHIADQAEFTPRNVQTVEGRRTTVYAIKLDVPNPEGKLKPGMPADVVFEP